MRKIIAKVRNYIALTLFIAIIMWLKAPASFCAEIMNEAFSKNLIQASKGAKVVGGEFITLGDGAEGWRATTATEAYLGEGEPNYIEYNLNKIRDIKEGTIEFWIQRNREGGVVFVSPDGNQETYDTVFELLRPDNSTSISCRVNWDYAENKNVSALYFAYYSLGTQSAPKKEFESVWGVSVPLDFKPNIGDWVHIALTFGENPQEDNKVYVNGKLQEKRIIIPAGRTYIEYGYFNSYLSVSDRLRIGIGTGSSRNYPGGTSLLYHSILSSFVIHDEIMTEFDLDRFSISGKPSDLKAEYIDGKVVLSWKAGTSQEIAGYNIYKKEADEASYVKINESEINGVSFEDSAVKEGKSYKYLVKGVNKEAVESNASNEAGVTIVSEFYRVSETSKDYDPRNLSGYYSDGKIVITWTAPKGFAPSGYNVYRRAGEGSASFVKLTAQPVRATSYTDNDVSGSGVYYYSVTALNDEGQEGRYPSEIKVEASAVGINSVSIDPARAVRAGEEVTVTVRGTAGKSASFAVAGAADAVAMTETGSGVYYGTFAAGSASVEKAPVTVKLGDATQVASATVTVDNNAPAKVIGLDIKNDWENEINLSWQASAEGDFKQYNIYRSESNITTIAGLASYATVVDKSSSEYWDKKVTPNIVYYYAVAVVDNAGNVGDLSEVVSARVLLDSSLPVISKIEEDSAGVMLKEGDILEVYVEGETGCMASFSIGGAIKDIYLSEDSRIGRYTGKYTVKKTDVANDFIVVKFVDRSENVATFASENKVNIDGGTKADKTAPIVESVSDNSWSIAGFSGKLVAGDMVTVELVGEAGGVAYFDIGGVATKVRMTEVEDIAGKYTGAYAVKDGDYAKDTVVTGYLADASGNVTALTSASKFTVDTTINIEVSTSQEVVAADKKTKVDIVAKATNLNGDAVSGHKIKFTLTTTDEYTGVVGSGKYTEFEDVVGGKLREEWRGETDAFGEVSATYVAGFAAKTTIIVAKDLNSGDIGVGHITSFISTSIDISLIAENSASRKMRTPGRGLYIQVTATPDKLTADGNSKSRIKAKVTDVKGQPVSGERIVFSMSSDNGNLVALDQSTDNRGIAEANYTAGTKLGSVVITALDTTANINGSVTVVLMSDAPAKVYISASRTSIPADGRSKADIDVKVSDVNDNPNQGAVVEYDVIKGSGSLDEDTNETNRSGEAKNGYRAGTTTGTVTIQAKVTSRIPSEDEVNRAKGTVFVGEVYDGFEMGEVKEWLKEAGDEVKKGDVIVRIATEMGDFDVTAKHDGKLYSIKKYKDSDFTIGETLGVIEIQQ